MKADTYSPAMLALTPMQRRFVEAYLASKPGYGALTRAARIAGYCKNNKNRATVGKAASNLIRDEKVLRAVRERLDQTFRHDAVVAHAVVMEIALDKTDPNRLKAALAVLDRGGFHATSEHVMHVQHTDTTDAAMRERIVALSHELGVDPRRLLGVSADTVPAVPSKGRAGTAADGVVIEGETIEAEAVTAPAPRVTRATRYVPRLRVAEFVKAGWYAPHPPQDTRDDRDLIEVLWTGAGDPIEPDTRPASIPFPGA
jgi:phage terminase small subunit